MKLKKAVVFVLAAFMFLQAYAEKPRSCIETALTQSELNRCSGVTYQAADKELNRVYKKIRDLYKNDKVFLGKMKEAQKAWIKLRDADFEMIYPNNDKTAAYGSSFPMCSSSYMTKRTLERIAYLKTWLVGVEEGDVCSGSPMFDHAIRDMMKK